MQKKKNISIVLIIGILILTTGFASASIIASMGMQGLEFIHPGIAKTVKVFICISGGIVPCLTQTAQGKIIGTVSQEAFQLVAEASPEAANVFIKYQQIQGYIDKGAEIIGVLQINENGEIKEGELKSDGQSMDISKMINSELEENTIVTNGDVLFFNDEDSEQAAIITFDDFGKNRFQTVYIDPETGEKKPVVIENIASQDYGNNPLHNYIKINKQGEIIETSLNFYGGKHNSFIVGGIEVDPYVGEFYYNGKESTLKIFEFNGKVLSLPKFKEGESIVIEGTQIDFPHELTLYGKAIIDKKGYFIEEGAARYNKILIEDRRADPSYNSYIKYAKGKPNILIPYSKEDLPEYYEGAYIIANENSIKFKSKNYGYDPFPDDIPASLKFIFEDGNKYIDITDKTKFEIYLGNEEGFEISKRDNQPPKIDYLYSGGGSKIYNDGMELSFYQSGVDTKILDSYHLDLNQLKQGKYKSAEFELEYIGDEDDLYFLNEGKIIMDSNGILTVKGREEENRILYKRYGLSDTLKKGMAEEDFKEYEDAFQEIISQREDLSFNLNSHNLITDSIKANLTADQMKNLMLKIPLNDDRSFNVAGMINTGITKGFHIGVETDKTLDLTYTALEEVKPFGAVSTTVDLTRALAEYQKYGNYEDVKAGFKIVTKYTSGAISIFSVENAFGSEDQTIKFADLKNKQDLAKTVASKINEYSQKITDKNAYGDVFYRYKQNAILINELHSNEGDLEGTDEIRDIISQNLNLDSKYYLISKANADLFQSTFEDIYRTLGNDTIKRIKEEIDPEGEHWFDFVMETASRNVADDLLSQDPEFFKDAIAKSLEDPNPKELLKNGAFLTNTFIEIYEKPELEKEKQFFGDFLKEKYDQSDTKEEKAVFGYLMKLNEEACNDPNKPDYKKICDELPSIPSLKIPNKWAADDKIAAKFYFYDDEAWFGATTKDYQKPPYNFKLIEQDDSTATLTKIVNGKELKIVLTLDNSDVQRTMEGDEFDIIAHRGHSFHLKDTFSQSSDKEKLLYLGSCGSFRETPNLQKNYPNAYLISDENTGQGAVNNWVSYELMYRLAQDTTTWESLGKDLGDEAGLVFPHEKNQLLLRFLQQVKE